MPKVLITGTNRGIGLATANRLLQLGHEVYGTSTSGQHTIKTAGFTGLTLDLRRRESIQELAERLSGVSLDYLVNNAAVLTNERGRPIDNEILRDTLQVNLIGMIDLTEQLLPSINDGGAIVNVSSSWGAFSEPYFDYIEPSYKISKTAVNMFSKLLAKRLEPRGIKVNSLDPGWTKTDMGGEGADRMPEDVGGEIAELLLNNQTGKFWNRGREISW